MSIGGPPSSHQLRGVRAEVARAGGPQGRRRGGSARLLPHLRTAQALLPYHCGDERWRTGAGTSRAGQPGPAGEGPPRGAVARCQRTPRPGRTAGRRAAVEAHRRGEDVERLESFSFIRIWSTRRGAHATDLERDTAERDAARYAVAQAEARRDAGRRDVESIQAQLSTLGDVGARLRTSVVRKGEVALRLRLCLRSRVGSPRRTAWRPARSADRGP
jgi:hypothetical protein